VEQRTQPCGVDEVDPMQVDHHLLRTFGTQLGNCRFEPSCRDQIELALGAQRVTCTVPIVFQSKLLRPLHGALTPIVVSPHAGHVAGIPAPAEVVALPMNPTVQTGGASVATLRYLIT
jgi:hypothetical protein